MQKTKKIIKFFLSIFICLSAGFIGSIFTGASVNSWYQTINKPSFNPPNWVFAPVWTILFIFMGIALFLVWSLDASSEKFIKRKTALIFFFLQLIFNLLWSLVFFGLRSPIGGLMVILILWILILITIIRFFRINKVSALFLIPYILWVSFAAFLNFTIWVLN